MPKTPKSVKVARRHVAQAERIVNRQRKVVDHLRADDHDTQLAERLLRAFQDTTAAMQDHLDYEERAHQKE